MEPTRVPRSQPGQAAAIPKTSPRDTARTSLVDAIEAYVEQPRFHRARWGIVVDDLDRGRLLYARNAHDLFIPASNAKLYTAALALDTLGPDYRFRTSLYATRRADARGVLHGNLILLGRGDPGLGMTSDGGISDAWADHLASILAQRGVRHITGDVIADDTWYAGPPYGSGWELDDALGGYAPPVSALSVQDNAFRLFVGGKGACCTLRIEPYTGTGVQLVSSLQRSVDGNYDPLGLYRPQGSTRLYVFGSRPDTWQPRKFVLAVPEPARMAGRLLVQSLERYGIRVDGHVRTRHWPHSSFDPQQPGIVHVTDVRSPPLRELVQHMLKKSDNLYAQLLLLAVGKQQQALGSCPDRLHPPTLTAAWGLCAYRLWLQRIGIAPGSALLEEGSGLSRKDRVTPSATVHLLEWIHRQPFADVIRSALPVAGVDGTLQYRMLDSDAAGNLEAKTGTLHLAYTLSGYVRAANGHLLAFSIMLNAYARPREADGRWKAEAPDDDLDAIALMIAGYGRVPLDHPATGTVRQPSAHRVPLTTGTGDARPQEENGSAKTGPRPR